MSNSLILFDWEEARGGHIQAALGQNPKVSGDGSLQCDAVGFLIGSVAVVVTVNLETDEILVVRGPFSAISAWTPITDLAYTIGEKLGSYWVGENRLGRRDTFGLALGAPAPNALPRCMFVVRGQALSCLQLG